MRTAIIDIGTLHVKFEVCEFLENGNLLTIKKMKELTVLGRDLEKNNDLILKSALDKTIEFLLKCKSEMEELSVDQYFVVSTDAIRKAKNADSVINDIVSMTGFSPKILSREQEGEIFFYGLTKNLPTSKFCAVDVGGGSVQVIVGNSKKISLNQSFKTGAYYLQDKFSKSHHPTKQELSNAKKYVANELSSLMNFKADAKYLVYGSTNIIDFLTAMNVDFKIDVSLGKHEKYVYPEDLVRIYEEIVTKSYEDRMHMFPTEPYYMWAADKALMNILLISEYLHIDKIVPTNSNLSTGLHNKLADGALY